MQDDPRDQDPGDVDARESARIRRRDRDADAAARDLMRPGMGKVFKQILDAQASAANAAPKQRKRRKRSKALESLGACRHSPPGRSAGPAAPVSAPGLSAGRDAARPAPRRQGR